MKQNIDISELAENVCQALIGYGVKNHSAWMDYASHYCPIVWYFRDHGAFQYDAGMLAEYKEAVQQKYDAEELTL